jgi:hypothetical protein
MSVISPGTRPSKKSSCTTSTVFSRLAKSRARVDFPAVILPQKSFAQLLMLGSRVTNAGIGTALLTTIIYFKPTTANFQEPSLCRFRTRTPLSFTLTGSSFGDIL